MLGYIFERLIKPLPESGGVIPPELGSDLDGEPEASPVGERLETIEERLEAEANASYGDELYHGRRMAGLSTMKFEGDGSVRGLRNAAVSLGYVVPLEDVASAETAQDRAEELQQENVTDALSGLDRPELTEQIEMPDPSPSGSVVGQSVSMPLEAEPVAETALEIEPAAEARVAGAPSPGLDHLEGGGQDDALSAAHPPGAAPQVFTTMAESNLVVGPASAPALAEIALFLADDEPETFEFYAPEELRESAKSDDKPPQDEAMVELLMAEVMREIHDESEAFELAEDLDHADAQDDHASAHLGHHIDIA